MTPVVRRLRRPATGLVVAVCALLLTSCGQSRTGTVKGTIKVGGKNLESGLITFQSEVGKRDVFSAKITDGAYETADIPVGPAKIAVMQSMVGSSQSHVEAGGNDLVPGAVRAKGKAPVQVPAKYHNADTSELTITINEGQNTFDKDLTP
ncbi:MAG TPA: hypothetical protein VKD90_15295 [Gemmataceae bacterium]|nr:hypothetical protein [Gemmataceae bacterium]